MHDKIILAFTVYDRSALREAYSKALLSSGYTAEEQGEKLKEFDAGTASADAAALIECFADAVDWMQFGVEY